MISLLEPLILYFVLFFPGLIPRPPAEGPIAFSTAGELNHLVFYTLPALALLWYLILKKNRFPAKERLRFRPMDILAFLSGLPGLALIGVVVSLGASLFQGAFESPAPLPEIEAPATALGWGILAPSCLATGYLEESFFRFYLFEKLESLFREGPFKVSHKGEWKRIILQAALFSACHFYEGPWGVLNALSAGFFLGLLYLQLKSLHGIAIAHGCYNLFVYGAQVFFPRDFAALP